MPTAPVPAPARRDHRREPAPNRRAFGTARRWSCARRTSATYRQLWELTRAARAACSPRHAAGRSRRHLGAEPLRVAGPAVRRPRASARSWSTSIPPTRPPNWSTPCASPASACCSWRADSARRTTCAMLGRSPRRIARSCARRWCSTTTGSALLDSGDAVTPERPRRSARRTRVRRSDQHPVHLGHHRLPQGRDALAPQHPQQRLPGRRADRTTPSTTACASRCRSTTLRHGARRNLACTTPRRVPGHPGRDVRSAAPSSRPSRPSAAPRCTACRPCSSLALDHPRFDEFDLSSLRTGIMAGAPCPVEVMKRVAIAHAHARR